ncbi:MAG: hypothetical protein DRQ99_29760 [Candidatus Parabeggiatoa sp. nov. 3]|nr:MAG: hypothetical protein DRQ99_29760 [Gammaproteobacteria bacterium]
MKRLFISEYSNELEDEIKTLSTSTCQAFFTVALQQGEVVDFEKDLKELETQGLVTIVNEQWQIRSRLFLKFLVDTENKKLCQEL